MLNIGDKTYRNLQEQVGFNSKRIEDILNILDGIGVYDNVIAIADISHTLTPAEIAIADKEVAFIIYNDQIYIKRTEAAGIAYFDVIFTITASTVISFNSKEIEANLTTGALTLTTTTASTYSKTELDTKFSAKADVTYVDAQLALKADLAGANFTGAITAPAITESMTGYSFSDAQNSTTKADIEYVYVGAVKNGNKLTLVNAFNVTRKTGATDVCTVGRFFIPTAVMDKIYPALGANLVDQKTCIAMINNYTITNVYMTVTKYDNISLYSSISNISSLTEGSKYYIRHEVTILLSDSMAP